MSKGYDEAGKFLCTHCNQSITGVAQVSYKLEEDFVEEWIMLHQTCVTPYKLAKKGLTHKCPKCLGTGKISTDTLNLWAKEDGQWELVTSSQMYRYQSRYNSGKFEVIKEYSKPCVLCDGEGYLAKEPVPVVVEWRKAT